jgi:alpha-mannosidase
VHLGLKETRRNSSTATLSATLPPQAHPVTIRYRTRTGALLRADGVAAGAYDREHHEVVLPPSQRERELSFEVELEALPTNGLPSGPGIVWWYLNARSHERPRMSADVVEVASTALRQAHDDSSHHHGNKLPVIGHSHLDVAWLWTYEQTERKAQRTFAIACDLLDRDPSFHFVQSQPQLYRFVEERDPQLFKRVCDHVAAGRFDPDVAALWVESDCNVPSGESLLRQMLFAHEYCLDRFGVAPQIAWLPDTFGFMNTLPQLLAHAGIPYFATTKLQWNDTTKFPYPQFVWKGPDGSSVIGALIQSYDGAPYPWRVQTAKRRNEPLVVGYGDGGGGVTPKMLEQVSDLGTWIRPGDWFEQLAARRAGLPVHDDELYLEYHRGVYTTHHDVKFHNALLERALVEAEELLAWCTAVHAPRGSVAELAKRLRDAWEIVLRNQFHDVLPGTSISPVYVDVAQEYAAAEEIVAQVIGSAQTILPRMRQETRIDPVGPREEDGLFVFDNGLVHAKVKPNGAVVDLAVPGARNVCAQANVLALYHDKPKAWEAWNIDRGYDRGMLPTTPRASRIEAGSLAIDFTLGDSPATMRVALLAGEPFLRVDLHVEWCERRRLLRVENWFAIQTDRATYGAPHGVIERSAREDTPAEQAKFEVPGQRFACVQDTRGDGVALLSLDTYGWSARTLPKGGVRLGHSLLRGTTWPDPSADLGEHHLSYAFAPFFRASTGALEQAWQRFAHERRVRLFSADSDAVIVAACKPAEDGDGVIVRVRECNGSPQTVRLRCGARMTEAAAVDALERGIDGLVTIEEESLIFEVEPRQLRSFRVRFRHGA